MMIGDPCFTQPMVHFKLNLAAVPAGFWTGQARSRTAPSMVIVLALGSILVPWRANAGHMSNTARAVTKNAWKKGMRFISLLCRSAQTRRILHHIPCDLSDPQSSPSSDVYRCRAGTLVGRVAA